MNAKKIDKSFYQPDSLNSLRNGWQRALNEQGRKADLKLDECFKKSREVLAARREQLTKLGLGNKPNTTRPLEVIEVDKLFEKDYFGIKSPFILQRTLWWNLTNHVLAMSRENFVMGT